MVSPFSFMDKEIVMLLKTDFTFHLGEQHRRIGKPNQDYALSGVLENGFAYAIVSDGCSSGGMTDVGSRLLVLATKRAFETYAVNQEFLGREEAVSVINMCRDHYLETYRELLGLQHEDLLATCLWAICDQDSVLVNIVGDGVVGVRYENEIVVHRFEWNKNAPYYPAYRLGNMNNRFKEVHAECKIPFLYTKSVVSQEGINHRVSDDTSTYSAEAGMMGLTFRIDYVGENTGSGKLLTVALFSDGVEQVEGLTYLDVVKKLIEYKSTKGQFAVRRMNRFLRDVSKVGRGANDDISCAVIQIGET